MISWIILSILYILPLIFIARLNISLTSKIFIFAIIDFIFYRITNRRNGYNSSELIEKLARILIYLSIFLPIAYGSYYLIFIFNSNKNGKIFGIISLSISSIIILYFLISFIKKIKDFAKEIIMIKQEEKRKRKIEKIINNFGELIKGLENDEAIALLEIEIPKLQEGETKEIYKKGLSKLHEEKRKEEERLKRKQERNHLLNEAADEVEYNIENNRFIETNIPLIAEEGCFEIFDNIEVYEYKTRYGATNYEKVGEGKLYITNKKLYFISDINAFPLVWLNNIMDVNWYFLEDENKFQLKITRDGNAIFLESYNEVDIFKMYYYIKTIMKNK